MAPKQQLETLQSSPDSTEAERIYIGGLNPPRLTVQDLLSRLKDSLGSVIEILPDTSTKSLLDNDTACYVHLKVKVKDTNDKKSALEHIAKLYHNSTWKGCKLRVEAARPHFLDRLKQEIQDRKANQLAEATAIQEEDQIIPEQSACTRRHLKVRERYGEQVFSVDTKPYAVDSWKGMHGLLRKIERRKKHVQEEQLKLLEEKAINAVNLRTHSKLNRAIHLRFSEDPSMEEDKNGDSPTVSSSASSTSKDSSNDSNDDDSTTSDTSSGDDDVDNQKATTLKSTYVWSSDDESGSESEDGGNSNNDSKEGTQPIRNHENSTSEEESSTSDSTDSDSEDHRNEDEEMLKPNPQKLGSKDFDEFESAMDTQNFSEVTTGNDGDHSDDSEHPEEASDSLLKDVESNLSLLASLFPDIKKTQPRKMADADEEGETGAAQASSKSGWSAKGVMLRYDPTKDVLPNTKNESSEGPQNDSSTEHNSTASEKAETSDGSGTGTDDEDLEEAKTEKVREGDESSDADSTDSSSSEEDERKSMRQLKLTLQQKETSTSKTNWRTFFARRAKGRVLLKKQ